MSAIMSATSWSTYPKAKDKQNTNTSFFIAGDLADGCFQKTDFSPLLDYTALGFLSMCGVKKNGLK
jgi:hypothetical protein